MQLAWSFKRNRLALICIVQCFTVAITTIQRVAGQKSQEEQIEFFEQNVRPVLIEHCYECHSTTTEVSGGLALDSREGLLQGGDSGSSIHLNEPGRSLLMQAIEYRDPKLQMPPSGKLSDTEIEGIRTWIAQGAFDPRETAQVSSQNTDSKALSVDQALEHWAYRPLNRVAPPMNSTAKHPIDAFLALKQDALSVKPSPVANIRVVQRRLDADLSGLCSQDYFATDVSDEESREVVLQGYVDELLASPRFGERFARHWMDLFRYAESLTLRGFVLQDAWRYRDYLIRAFNEDRPIDQFISEQIAGDLMTSDSMEQRQQQCVAIMALTLGDHNYEEQDKLQLEMDYIDEQIDTIGKTLLGQTISCARCHDHKFDPIPTRDYYALAGIMKSSTVMQHDNVSKWVRVPLPISEDLSNQYIAASTQLNSLREEQKSLKAMAIKDPSQPLLVRSTDYNGIVVDNQQAMLIGDWQDSTSSKAFVDLGYVHDKNANKGKSSITFEPKMVPSGEFTIRLAYSYGENRSSKTIVRVFSADGESEVIIDQRKPGADDGLWQTLGKYRFETSGQAFVVLSNETSDGYVIADAVQFVPVGIAIRRDNDDSLGSNDSMVEHNEAKNRVIEIESKISSLQQWLDGRPMVQGLIPLDKPSDVPVHIRGSVHRLGETVPRGMLDCINRHSTELASLSVIGKDSNGRLELARWLVDERNPLTARVYVNRVWSWLMGRGIVSSLDNFGTTGEQPSNPELLDWLTSEFIAHGWSTKWLVREIVTSNAYQRQCAVEPKLLELDPDNELLGHANLRRLDAESLRDRMLAFSGELDLQSHIQATWEAGLKEDYRYESAIQYRTVYQPWFRNSLPELATEFDVANPSSTTSQRFRSTVAPQALAIMNSPWVEKRVKAAAKRIDFHCCSVDPDLAGHLLDRSRIGIGFQLAFGRSPDEEEIVWATKVMAETSLEELAHQLMASIEFRFIE